MSRSFDSLPCRTCVGVEIPSAPIDANAYFTLDSNGARWDIYRQPASGDFTGVTFAYGASEGFLLASTESILHVKIASFADTHKVVNQNAGVALPDVPYKPIASTPVYGPPNKPEDLGGPDKQQPVNTMKPDERPDNTLMIAGVAAAAAFLFFGTLKVK